MGALAAMAAFVDVAAVAVPVTRAALQLNRFLRPLVIAYQPRRPRPAAQQALAILAQRSAIIAETLVAFRQLGRGRFPVVIVRFPDDLAAVELGDSVLSHLCLAVKALLPR